MKQIVSLVGSIASTPLIYSKLLNSYLSALLKCLKILTLLSHPLQTHMVRRCPQLRPETQTQRWINPSGRLVYLQRQLLKIGCRLSRAHKGIKDHVFGCHQSLSES
jgi:hypothetical protein